MESATAGDVGHRRTGGWGGSVWSRRCAPRPSRARVSRAGMANAASEADVAEAGCCARRPPSSRRSIGTVTSGRAAVASSSPRSAASSDRPSAIGSRTSEMSQRNKNRDVGSRREPLGRRGAPAAGAGRSAHADARRAPRARAWAASMENAANFRGGIRQAGCCARRPPSSRRSIGTVTSGRAAVRPSSSASAASSDRPSAIVSPDPRFVQKNKNRDVGSRREPLGRRSAPAAGAGRSAHADARRAPRARVWAARLVNATRQGIKNTDLASPKWRRESTAETQANHGRNRLYRCWIHIFG